MTKNIGNKTLNERATAGGTAAGIVMVILGFELSDKIFHW